MNCEFFKSEMYAWRPGSEPGSFQPLFDHLANCPECARFFEELTASDRQIQRTFQKIPESHSLEVRILSGLAHQRTQTKVHRPSWKAWILLPFAAAVLLIVTLAVRPRLEEARVGKEVASLLNQPPALQIDSTNRQQILDWCAGVLSGSSSLPPELNKVEFRGATAVRVADHKAVLLKMKNEQRASLLIVDARLAHENGFESMHEQSGSASLWSDGQRTYVLLFKGSAQEMHTYMVRMGIEA